MSEAGTFVYLLEEDAVLAMLPGWPAGMQVAVCLSPGGGCELAVHHHDEVARVLERIAALQGGAREDICVAPPVEGYPTRKVLFSEEQQLLSIVAENPNLPELASDYAINYRFAEDEGLDDPSATAVPQPDHPQRASASVTLGDTGPSVMSARSQAFITHLSLPSGYATPSPEQRPECSFVDAHLTSQGGRVRLVIAPDEATGSEVAVPFTRIGFRDDFAMFVLPRAALERWSQGRAAVLEMSADLFPEAFILRFSQEAHLCRVTLTQRGIFVTPLGPVAAASLLSRPAAASPVQKRRWLKSVHVAVAALVAVMVVTGHFAAALDRAPVKYSSPTVSGDHANPALDLVAAMARAEATAQVQGTGPALR